MARLHNVWNGNESEAEVFIRDERIGTIAYRNVTICGRDNVRLRTEKKWCWSMDGHKWCSCRGNTWNEARRDLVLAWLMSEDV